MLHEERDIRKFIMGFVLRVYGEIQNDGTDVPKIQRINRNDK